MYFLLSLEKLTKSFNWLNKKYIIIDTDETLDILKTGGVAEAVR